jgi:DNA-binding CsgD family transcriptional regulator/MFS family permease
VAFVLCPCERKADEMTGKVLKNRIFNNLDSPMVFFSLFSAWTLAIVFMGQAMNAHAVEMQIESTGFVTGLTLLATISGLIVTGFYIKTMEKARLAIEASIILSIVGTAVFFIKSPILWQISMIVLSFVAGTVIACWGIYFKGYKTSNEKLQAAANIIIYSNVGMIIINVISANISTYLGISVSLMMLLISFYFFLMDKKSANSQVQRGEDEKERHMPLLKKSLILLYLFIALITIDSGMMYNIVNPAFSHHVQLISFYWAVPYIGTIFLLKKLPERINRSYVLYMAVAMIGFAYILFYLLDKSALSYVIIDTFMLGAFGICDLFWWVILGEMLAFTNNPIKIFGIGLSANVLGVFFGYAMCSALNIMPEQISVSIALGIVLISLLVLPKLYDELSRLIKNQAFLIGLTKNRGSAREEVDSKEEVREREPDFMEVFGLTGREAEIARLLLGGRTYKMIGQELFISENTVKTHIKNIYTKMNVVNKTEFLEMMKITRKR